VDQPTNCPPWCVADHAVDDDFVARHRSRIHDLAVIAPDRGFDLMIEFSRLGDEPSTWVYLGDGTDQRLELSLESVRRLVDELRSAAG
jgi:hypothetical protein